MTVPGPGVDAQGRQVVDPTRNVLALVEAAIARQDDLRTAETAHVREIMDLRARHEDELRRLERQRVDDIRRVDVSEARTVRRGGLSSGIAVAAVVVSLLSLIIAAVAIVTR